MASRPSRPPGRARSGVLTLITALAVCAVVGCGGGGTTEDPDLSPLGPAPPPPGMPVAVMIWAPRDTTTGIPFPDLPLIGEAFADLANTQGGVNGRPLKVIDCDEAGSADGAMW